MKNMTISFIDKAIIAATVIGLIAWFVTSPKDAEVSANRLILVVALTPLPIFWKLLHKRFNGWAIFAAYIMIAIGVAIISTEKPNELAVSFLFAAASTAGLVLYSGRRNPLEIEELRPTVIWMVVNGLWDQLAKEGLPPDEIERLKRLTPEERERLMASVLKPSARTKHPRLTEDKEGWTINGYGYGRFGSGFYQDGMLISESDDFWASRENDI